MPNSEQEKVLSPSRCPGDALATEDCTELTSDFWELLEQMCHVCQTSIK